MSVLKLTQPQRRVSHPHEGDQCARAEHRASIKHHSVRRPSMRASEQRRVSILKLTQPQRRASYPDTHEGDQLRKSSRSASSKHRAPQRTPPKHASERAAACVDAKADAAAVASVRPPQGRSVRKSRASSKHQAPQRTPPKHESERAAACVDAKADAAAAASITPTRAISCTRAEHRVSIEHHSVRRPSMRASEQRRVSMLKLTQPQRRASHPRGRSAVQEPSIEQASSTTAYAAQA